MVTKCVYRLTNTSNGKIYVGSTVNYARRKEKHLCQLRKDGHGNSSIQQDFNKYGECYFEFDILEYIEDNNIILEKEEYWINKLDAYNPEVGYNRKYSVPTKSDWRISDMNSYVIAQKNSIKIKNNDTGEVYESIKSASRLTGINRNIIRKSIRNEIKKSKHHWSYV